MKAKILFLALGLLAVVSARSQQRLQPIPVDHKWLNNKEVAFTYDGSYTDPACFKLTLGKKLTRTEGFQAPEKYTDFPLQPKGAVNLTFSPDSTKLAFTRANDLWVVDIASQKETRLTFDGTETVMNGYASWVYYEEILGRPSRYRAFWWSPDSETLAFYHFDDTEVPMFPIYSPKGQDGILRRTHYPKVGERNPEVKIGFVKASGGDIVWADFNEKEDQYFGIPFWGADSKAFFVAREPRIQNTLDLYAVSPADGSKKAIYHEEVPTWLDWIEGMLFTEKGLYMVRSFETGWQQIYFLTYDGQLKRLTDGPNWRIELLRAEKDGTVYFLAERDSHVRQGLYKVSPKGVISALTDPSLYVLDASFAPDGKHFITQASNLKTPWEVRLHDLKGHTELIASQGSYEGRTGELVSITVDGLELPGVIYYPEGFDPAKKYPVHVDIYGGPDSPQVFDRWVNPARYGWYSQHGIIELIADCRAAGHNGREGLDAIYKRLSTIEIDDFVEWAKWLQSLPYVKGDKIGVEGFSFGGTMTTLLVATASEYFHYGIAGGGVYDWMLYDTHYTERFMSTPQDNPDGYHDTAVIRRVGSYPVKEGKADGTVMLKITHGTGDDNVHFQNTLQLIDVLQKQGAAFDFMIYPDGMHGYRGYQGAHFQAANYAFWEKYLLEK
ncbi:MAG: S9 family peptidase [Bacteroidales bacterium]|nr:S9 family peptidase [Bacteroidales bacterium]